MYSATDFGNGIQKYKLLLISLISFSILFAGYPQLTQTNDFLFHYNISKGICIYPNNLEYCSNYYLIDKLFLFPNELVQYIFFGLIFLFVFPLLICKDFKEVLIYFSLGFSYNIIKSSIYPQGLGLIILYFWFEKQFSKLILLILSLFIHKYLTLFLLALILFEFIYDKFKLWD